MKNKLTTAQKEFIEFWRHWVAFRDDPMTRQEATYAGFDPRTITSLVRRGFAVERDGIIKLTDAAPAAKWSN